MIRCPSGRHLAATLFAGAVLALSLAPPAGAQPLTNQPNTENPRSHALTSGDQAASNALPANQAPGSGAPNNQSSSDQSTASSSSTSDTLARVVPGSDRELKFDFSGADWRSVLDWFAGEAHLNLEWTELPEGEFNLITDRKYSITQSLDIINMHLLGRGFTLIRRGEVLVLMKLGESFDTTLVPRITLAALDERGRFEFVRVSFPLEWMLAEAAVKELEPMLSPYGTLVPMAKTNRIEAMDTVENLLEIRDLLLREESGNTQERLVTEFVLEHTSAVDIIGKLHQLLGVEKPLARMSNGQMQVVREQIALKAEMAKRMGDKAPGLQENKTDVFLVANEQRNSIIANAPPDKIAMIKQAVQALDIPNTNTTARLSEITTMKVYPLNGADPDAVVDILQDLVDVGELHPNARFSEDDDKQILFAFASLKDHMTIMSVMEQLAGSSRSFKVITLKRLKAGYVARAIESLMGAEVADSRSDSNRWRGRDTSSWKGFKVNADIPNNRLFLFATETENSLVEELLVKIGERSRANTGARVIKVSPDTIDDTIEQIRQQWPSVSENPLDIRLPARAPAKRDGASSDSKTSRQNTSHRGGAYIAYNASTEPQPASEASSPADSAPADSGPADSGAADSGPIDSGPIDSVSADIADQPASQTGEETSAATSNQSSVQSPDQLPEQWAGRLGPPTAADRLPLPPPVILRKSAEDELVISSQDSAALAQLEGLLTDVLPVERLYTSFGLKFISPMTMESKLTQVFGTDGAGGSLPFKFVTDEATRSILILGAGPTELREIGELIEFYDQPAEVDPLTERKPRFIRLKHASAESVVVAIKDLYRDYLSINDRALVPAGRERAPAPVSTMTTGLLSVGVDTNTNTVVLSAPGYLADEIEGTVEGLDVPEATTVIQTVSVGDDIYSANAIAHLSRLLAPPSPANDPDAANRMRNMQDRGGQDGNDRDNDRNSDRSPSARGSAIRSLFSPSTRGLPPRSSVRSNESQSR